MAAAAAAAVAGVAKVDVSKWRNWPADLQALVQPPPVVAADSCKILVPAPKLSLEEQDRRMSALVDIHDCYRYRAIHCIKTPTTDYHRRMFLLLGSILRYSQYGDTAPDEHTPDIIEMGEKERRDRAAQKKHPKAS